MGCNKSKSVNNLDKKNSESDNKSNKANKSVDSYRLS